MRASGVHGRGVSVDVETGLSGKVTQASRSDFVVPVLVSEQHISLFALYIKAREHTLTGITKWPDVVSKDVFYGSQIDAEIVMNNRVAESSDRFPWNLGLGCFDRL